MYIKHAEKEKLRYRSHTDQLLLENELVLEQRNKNM